MAESMPMPEKRDQHDHEDNGANAGTRRGSTSRRVRILAALPAIPYLSRADKNEDERPIGPENGPRVEARTPVAVQDNRADRNQQYWDNQGSAPRSVVFSHHTPPHSLVRTPKQKSSGNRTEGVLSGAY